MARAPAATASAADASGKMCASVAIKILGIEAYSIVDAIKFSLGMESPSWFSSFFGLGDIFSVWRSKRGCIAAFGWSPTLHSKMRFVSSLSLDMT